MTTLEAALLYASWGWHVLPVVPNGKIPATSHGVKDATTDAEQIKKWWTDNPRLNIGIACGKISGIIVFDIDPRNGGTDSWDLWTSKNEKLGDGCVQITAGGGFHYLSHYVEGIKSCKMADGIDLLSDGRYFIASPSSIDGKEYTWELSSSPLDGMGLHEIPQSWLVQLGAKKKSEQPGSTLIKGNRNDGLASLAGAMRNFGMTEAEILAAISVANETRCEIPLPASEIRQIAKSVARYESDSDLAASAALGAEAAEALGAREDPSEYFFTRATSFLSQPSPIPWVIKGWLPAYGTAMIFGESEAGKTFIALDMALSIVLGEPWCGRPVKKSTIAYLAGEGNYGIRSRIAAWCKEHERTDIENLIVSNEGIAMDQRGAVESILGALKKMPCEPPGAIFIDTINAHMAGDENKAQDTRSMLNSCGIIGAATGATVVLIHHVGNNSEVKDRARGSSAWKGALDSSILVEKKDGIISISCKKMKDAPYPQKIYGELRKVNLGWYDEDNKEISSVCFNQLLSSEAEKLIKQNNYKTSEDKKLFKMAWEACGRRRLDGQPYLTRGALLDYLIESQGISRRTASDKVKPAGRYITGLVACGYIAVAPDGWVVCDSASCLEMSN